MDVDFDFFDTPRDVSPQSKKSIDKKPPSSTGAYRQKKHGDQKYGNNKEISAKEEENVDYSDVSFSSSDSERSLPNKLSEVKKKPLKKYSSESSSAYSNSDSESDYSSDEEHDKHREMYKKEKIDVHIPKPQVEAWSEDPSNTNKHIDNHSKQNRHVEGKKRNRPERKSMSESSDSDNDHGIRESRSSTGLQRERTKSTKYGRRDSGRKKPLKSNGSYSNNSDITDVSPLESPEGSPRFSRKTDNDRGGKENGKYKDVQYSPRSTTNQSINLERDEIDLSVLMKCMSDIDREKQERLKSNSRRVMFAQPATAGDRKMKGNYTFSMGQAKMIEKENQRLLKQIMTQMNSKIVKKAPSATQRPQGPKRVTPFVQRMTPSAVNRMREQRRIEEENMHILGRLRTVKPSKGMSRNEQIDEAERQMSYGIPSGTLVIQGQSSHYDTVSNRSLHSSTKHTGFTQRSRPSSAKSNTSIIMNPGKRSRPSSAKSDVSMRSNASMRSDVSKMSSVSMRSNVSNAGVRRLADGRVDKRPQWDDRFSFS